MDRNFYILLLFIVGFCVKVKAQNDSINWLDEVRLSDVKLKNNSKGQFVKKLSDSVIQRSEPMLTSVLKFNSPFFFRENGYGMVSSASVRGTGASQTAVIWNGININSQFTGQTDFNTINTRVFDNISLRPGGGSVVYGSGAIGGTIHLSNDLRFDGKNRNFASVSYGSFETVEAAYNGSFSNEKTSLNVGVSGISSENDYKYIDTEVYNENGDFYNISWNASVARWLGDANILKFYSNYYQGDRGFSGTLNLPSNSKYEDRNAKNLLEWKSFLGSLTSSLKLAWLQEQFRYFENRDSDNFSFGEAETAILKYNLTYELSEAKTLDLIGDYNDIKGKGSGIENETRKIAGISLLWSQELNKLHYELSLRKEFTNTYDSPVLFSAGAGYQFSEYYLLRLNASRNFRMPTFNDLFWLEGGNLELEPETSIQAEIGNEFFFNDLRINFNAYYIDITDLIRWIPTEGGIWRPENTAEVYNYGFEVFAEWRSSIGENPVVLSSNYAFTRSIDEETENQLIYTPKHKATISGSYQLKDFSFLLQSLYNGSIYTSSDNQYEIEGYLLSNLSVEYRFEGQPELILGIKVSNLFNKKYENMPSRIMPGRSLKSTLTFKF